mgnify:CR=1 FL=1
MTNYNEKIKKVLDGIIANMSENKEKYVIDPKKNFIRNRKLPFETMVKLILSMKGNTLNKELYDFFGKNPEEIVSSSAFVQQRTKISEQFFIDLFHNFNNSMTDMKTFKGYKIYAVDGSDINIAFDADAPTYIRPQHTKKGELTKGFNQYHLNAIYDVLNRVYVDAKLQPRPQLNERRMFLDMLQDMNLPIKTIFIADRGYPSWNFFANFKHKKNAEYVVRVRDSENLLVKHLPMIELDIDRKTIATCNTKKGKLSGYSYFTKKKIESGDWDFGEEEELNFRIVRFKISDTTYETIMTSLPRDKFSIEDIKKLYAMRWGIETSFRQLKYVIGLTNFHAKKDSFIVQEIFAKLTMYNFCERIISAAVVKQDNNRKYSYQVNYTMGMQICLDFFRSLVKTDNVYSLILKYIEAIKPGRSDVRKLKPKTFVCFTYRVAA